MHSHNDYYVAFGTPGPPVMYQKATDPEDEGAGYGYSNGMSQQECDVFYYHSDHLGSTSYITDRDGNATQFVCYKPYGEALVDEHNTTFEQPWKFNGKELDSETGLYYYGARYYEPVLAMWYGVDALAEKYPNMGGYVYCVGNPVRLVDVDGNEPLDYLLGIVGALADNALCGLVDFRSYCADFATDAKDFNGGLIAGDMLSVAIGVHEMNSGAGMMAAGTTAVTVGVAAEVPSVGTSTVVVGGGGVVILGGAALEAHGTCMMAQGVSNIANKKGHLPEKTNTINEITFTQKHGPNGSNEPHKVTVKIPDGYKKINERGESGKTPIFTNGKNYISPDIDGHNGGTWKMSKTVEGLEKKSTRMGTYDADLNRIGD